MSKNKPVGLSYINNLNKETEKVEKYYLDFEKGEYINYYPIFGEDKIEELFKDLLLSIQEAKKEKIKFFDNDIELIKHTHFLIIKHFTSLKSELKGKSLKIQLATFAKLVNTGLFEKFMTDMFDELEIQKVIDKLNTLSEFGDKFNDLILAQKQELEEKIHNKQLLNTIN